HARRTRAPRPGGAGMHGILRGTRRRLWLVGAAAVTAAITAAICAGAASNSPAATTTAGTQGPTFTWDVAHDTSPPLRDLAPDRIPGDAEDPADEVEGG